MSFRTMQNELYAKLYEKGCNLEFPEETQLEKMRPPTTVL